MHGHSHMHSSCIYIKDQKEQECGVFWRERKEKNGDRRYLDRIIDAMAHASCRVSLNRRFWKFRAENPTKWLRFLTIPPGDPGEFVDSGDEHQSSKPTI